MRPAFAGASDRARARAQVLLVNWLVRAMIEREGHAVAPNPVVREEVGARNGGAARTPVIKLRGLLSDDSTEPTAMDWKFRGASRRARARARARGRAPVGDWWTEVDGRRVSDKFRFESVRRSLFF